MFFVDLYPSPSNKEVYEIQYINNAIVTIEPERKVNNIVQCHRCQQYGHTKSYCTKSFTCVKRSLGYPTAECKKSIDEPPRCVNCLNHHTANYKGSQVYQALRRQILPENRNQKH